MGLCQFTIPDYSSLLLRNQGEKKKLKAAGNMHPQSKAKRNEKIYQIQFSEQLTNNLEEDS